MSITIQNVHTLDIRFPTSQQADGSDAMNPDPDYSAAYVILETDGPHEGHGLTFTIGHGNELCVQAASVLATRLKGRTLESLTSDMLGLWKLITGDSQLRWLGPDKGVIHLAAAAVINAVWDLYAKTENKPLWQLLADMSPEEITACVDFSYIQDVLSQAEAVELLHARREGMAARLETLQTRGFPAYTTSAGWLGYSDDKLRRLCAEGLAEGFTHFKLKVGSDLEDDQRRARIIRDSIGADNVLMMDANQVWSVAEAVSNMRELAEFTPLWIEEPTHPDDILGHAAIAKAVSPIAVATGEHCANQVMFKQFLQAGGLQVCQLDAARLGGVNEVLGVLLLAAKFNVPVCPHAGGVGLCEYVQHLSMFDYLCVGASLESRILEYVDHLHEHFTDPVVMKNGHYQLPKAPGYSITMKAESLQDYAFPNGPAWQ
ncbi:MAG: L-fuconate dehydratase [Deinococcota bacterium]